MNQTITLDNLLEAVIDETGVSHDDLCRYQRDPKIDQARGIYYLIARQYGFFNAKEIGSKVRRSRACTIIVTGHYLGYYDTKDSIILDLVNRINERIKNQYGR